MYVGERVEATHGLIFVLAGIFSRWKQNVAFYLTPNSYDGSLLQPIALEIIKKAEFIGLSVHNITNDMGPNNLAMWRKFLVGFAGWYSTIVNSITHPIDNNRKLWFIADPGHLLKNLKFCLLNNKTIDLPAKIVNDNNFSSSLVECLHVKELAEFQENLQFKLAPNIKLDDFSSGTFNKMKVNKAKNFLSRDVSTSLQFLATENSKQEYCTTAFFIEIVSKWFTLVTSRAPKVALGKTIDNIVSEKKFEESITFLESIIELFQEMKVGNGQQFKPVQRGVIITTKSIIELSIYLINEKGYLYVLAGRLTSDCVENIFSCIRAKHPSPTALQFKQNLKIIAISKYLKPIGNSSYDEDDRIIVGDFLSKPKAREIKKQLPPVPDLLTKEIHIGNVEMNILYYIAGYILSRISHNNISCKLCLSSAGSPTYESSLKFAKFVLLKSFRRNTLFFVNDVTFQYFYQMEIIIRQYLPYLKTNFDTNKYDLVNFFHEKMQNIACETLKDCHNIKNKIMTRFSRFRLRIEQSRRRLPNKMYNSKTMAMHAAIR